MRSPLVPYGKMGGVLIGEKRFLNKMINMIISFFVAACFSILLLSGNSRKDGPGQLPEFTFKGVALHPDRLSFAP